MQLFLLHLSQEINTSYSTDSKNKTVIPTEEKVGISTFIERLACCSIASWFTEDTVREKISISVSSAISVQIGQFRKQHSG